MSPISQRLPVSSEISGSKTVSTKTTRKRKAAGRIDNLSFVAKENLPVNTISKKQCLKVKKFKSPVLTYQDPMKDSFEGAFLRYNRPLSVLIDKLQDDEERPLPTYFDKVWDILYLHAKVIGNMRGLQYSTEPRYKDIDRPIAGSELTELEDIAPKLDELFPEHPKKSYNPSYFGDSLLPQSLDSDYEENLDSYSDYEENSYSGYEENLDPLPKVKKDPFHNSIS